MGDVASNFRFPVPLRLLKGLETWNHACLATIGTCGRSKLSFLRERGVDALSRSLFLLPWPLHQWLWVSIVKCHCMYTLRDWRNPPIEILLQIVEWSVKNGRQQIPPWGGKNACSFAWNKQVNGTFDPLHLKIQICKMVTNSNLVTVETGNLRLR